MIQEVNKNQVSTFKITRDVYFNCSKAMDELIKSPRILFPILLSIIVPFLFFTLSKEAFIPYYKEMAHIATLEEARETMFVGVLVNVLQNVFMLFVRAIVLFGLFKAFKLKGSFKQVLAITGFSYLAIVPMMIIMCIAGQFTGELFINFSPAIFIQSIKGTNLYGFVRGLCIFFIWQHSIIAFGTYRLTKSKKAILFVIIIFFAQIILNIGNQRWM